MAEQITPYEIKVNATVIENRKAKIEGQHDELKNNNDIREGCVAGDFSGFNPGDVVELVLVGVTTLSCKVKTQVLINPHADANKNVYGDEVHLLDSHKIFIPRDLAIKIDAFKNFFKRKMYNYCNMMFYGHSGFGKTTIARYMAHMLGIKQVKIDMGAITNPLQFIGYDGLQDGSTHFQFNDWITDMQNGDSLVILDEVDKINNPQVWAILNPLLDGVRRLRFRNYDIKIGENVGFVGTMNHQWEDTASQEVSTSLMSRFGFKHEMDALPPALEVQFLESYGIGVKDATKIVEVLNKLRKSHADHKILIEISTRKTEFLANLIMSGFSIRMALDLTYTQQLDTSAIDQRLELNTIFNAAFKSINYDKLGN